VPLTAVDFVPKGPVKSADLIQFYNLFTGVMVDQPVTFSNALLVGGNQGQTTVPLKLFGAVGQTNHLIDLYGDRSQGQPGWGTDAKGTFSWGPGGAAPQDSFLGRIGTQNGHGADTAGLLVTPRLEVTGVFQPGEIVFASGGTIKDYGSGNVVITNSLTVQNNLYIGDDDSTFFVEQRAHEVMLNSTLLINGADAEGSSLQYAINHLQVRSDNLPDSNGSGVTAFDAMCFAGNWLQFNARFVTVVAGQGWGQKALVLAYDVDNSPAAGGQICLMGGRVGIGGFPQPTLQALQVSGDIFASGDFWSTGGDIFLGSAHISDGGSGMTVVAGDFRVQGTNLYIGTRRIYDAGGSQGLHFDWDVRIDSAHDVYTHSIHLVSAGDDCRIDTVGDMNYWGPNGSTNHRFHHVDGSWMGCQAANFVPQSTRASKPGAVVMADADCMTRIRNPISVYTWPVTGVAGPAGQSDIGFMAEDMVTVAPEMVGYNADGSLFGIQYDNITGLLWGALRSLDARCQAKGI
jgi:hypothetical protein